MHIKYNRNAAFIATIWMLLVWGSAQASAATITFSTRALFEAQLGTQVVDTYSAPGYFAGDRIDQPSFDIHTNLHMSSILGETDYVSTGHTDINQITNQTTTPPDPYYCAGCNGSFLLSFTTTSVGTTSGVFGVGFDLPFANNSGTNTGFVTFGDNSTANYGMPGGNSFFGITSDLSIKSIHLGLPNGGPTIDTAHSFSIDNLTIGSPAQTQAVPEPSTFILLVTGLASLIGYGYRRRQ